MDTDELSQEAYRAIFLEAENFDHDLSLQFGLLSESSNDETEYLQNALDLIAKLKKMDEDLLSDIFFDEVPDQKSFHNVLHKMAQNIRKVQKIPVSKRTYDDWA